MKTRTLHHGLLGCALLAGGLCLSPQAADRPSDGLFPTPTAGMVVPGRGPDEPTLEELLRAFGAVSGEHLSWTEDTGQALRSARPGLDRELDIPAGELYSVVETILRSQRFAFVDQSRTEPRRLAVILCDAPDRGARGRERQVDPEELPLYQDHPAIQITTTVTLENLDVRLLGNALRAMIVDPYALTIIPVPGSRRLLLTGYGSDLVRLVRLLRDLNENARPRSESR